MKFRIVYDKPGRIRFRCGPYAFEPEFEGRIHKACVGLPCVKSATVHSSNGGILLEYGCGESADDLSATATAENRQTILNFIALLNPKDLPEVDPETDFQLQSLDDNFQNNLCKMIARRYLMRWFVPLPIRTAITVFAASNMWPRVCRHWQAGI